jgi:hypothetical protein
MDAVVGEQRGNLVPVKPLVACHEEVLAPSPHQNPPNAKDS